MRKAVVLRALVVAFCIAAVTQNTRGFEHKQDWPLSMQKGSVVVLLLPLSIMQAEGLSVAEAEIYGVFVKLRDGHVVVQSREDWQSQLSPFPNAFIIEKVSRNKAYTEVELRNLATFVKLRFEPSISNIDAIFSQLVKSYDPATYPAVAVIVSADQTYSYIFKMVKPTENPENAFEDAGLRIQFGIVRVAFGFVLENKSEGPIKIDWNQVAYVDPSGTSHKVMHEGVRYILRNEPMVPTMVPPGARVSDVIVPTNLIDYKSGSSGGWEVGEPFPSAGLGQKFRGKTISFFMPLEVNGAVKNYNFVFSIDIGSGLHRKK